MILRLGTVLITVVALAAGGAAGWFAARAWGGGDCGNVELWNCGNMETANDGRSGAPNGKTKPRRRAQIRSSADAEVQKRILENKISYLERCIAAAKGDDAKPAEKKRESNVEIIERLKKLSSDDERYLAFMRLDEKTQMSFTMGELKKLCPKQMSIYGDNGELYAELTERLDRMTEVAARRIGILDALDPSALNDEERKVHAEFMDFLAECPNVFANMIDQPDSMTWGEVHDRIEKMISTAKRGPDLVKKEREMLIAKTVKSFELTDGDAVDLRATLDDVQDFTGSGYFEKKD